MSTPGECAASIDSGVVEVADSTLKPVDREMPRLTRLIGRLPPVVLLGLSMSGFQGGSALAIKAYPVGGPVGTSCDRMAAAAIALWIIFRPRVRTWSRASLAQSALFGVPIACILISGSEANSRLPLGEVVTIASLGPLAVSAITRRRGRDVFWGLLALGGVVLIARPTGHANIAGLAFSVGWACAWAAYILLGNRMHRGFATMEWLPVAISVAALICAPVAVAQSGLALLRTKALLLGMIAGVVGNAVTYILELEALRRMPTNLFGICMSFEPGFAALWGLLLLDQSLHALQLAGVVLVIAAAAATSRSKRRA